MRTWLSVRCSRIHLWRHGIYLFQLDGQGLWVPYQDYTLPVSLPRYLADPPPNYVTLLSAGTSAYDYVSQGGHKNIGSWIDQAAQQVGR